MNSGNTRLRSSIFTTTAFQFLAHPLFTWFPDVVLLRKLGQCSFLASSFYRAGAVGMHLVVFLPLPPSFPRRARNCGHFFYRLRRPLFGGDSR